MTGYAGMWILADEAHVTSIASHRDYRRRGIGEALLIALVEMAIKRNARVVTLEARVSNVSAQSLYVKLGFTKQGIRKGYYLDNSEDAVIMTTDFLGSESFRQHLDVIKEAHAARWGKSANVVEAEKSNPC